MTTLTVQEASQSLGHWLRRAASGEQIAIKEGESIVLLQPLADLHKTSSAQGLSAREALRHCNPTHVFPLPRPRTTFAKSVPSGRLIARAMVNDSPRYELPDWLGGGRFARGSTR